MAIDYDNWKLSSGQEDEKVYCECDHCGGEIYEREEYIATVDDDRVHEGCLTEYAMHRYTNGYKIAGQ